MSPRTDAIIRNISTHRTPAPAMEENPIQRALDNYHEMEHQRDMAVAEAADLRATNSALLAEINMLREAYERADTDRIRLQTIASTLLGRLLAINDTIAGAVKASIKDGIEAVHAAKAEDELEQAGDEAQDILQRVRPEAGTDAADIRMASVEALQPREMAIPPNIDWRQLPQG